MARGEAIRIQGTREDLKRVMLADGIFLDAAQAEQEIPSQATVAMIAVFEDEAAVTFFGPLGSNAIASFRIGI